MSKIDEEDFEIGKKVVELLQKQFAKTALTTHKHAEILDILQDSQQTIAQVSSRTWVHILLLAWATLGSYGDNSLRLRETGQKWGKSLQASWASSKAVRQDGIDNAQTCRHFGHPARFPADYRSGEQHILLLAWAIFSEVQQAVTETLRFVFEKLGGSDQAFLREVFAGELSFFKSSSPRWHWQRTNMQTFWPASRSGEQQDVSPYPVALLRDIRLLRRQFASSSRNWAEVIKLFWGKSLQASWASSKAVRQDGIDNAQTCRHFGHPARFPADYRSGEQQDVSPCPVALLRDIRLLRRRTKQPGSMYVIDHYVGFLVLLQDMQGEKNRLWSGAKSLDQHHIFCLWLNCSTFTIETYDFTKETAKIDQGPWIGSEYELRTHNRQSFSQGGYYLGEKNWMGCHGGLIKEAEVSLLAGNPPEKRLDDNVWQCGFSFCPSDRLRKETGQEAVRQAKPSAVTLTLTASIYIHHIYYQYHVYYIYLYII